MVSSDDCGPAQGLHLTQAAGTLFEAQASLRPGTALDTGLLCGNGGRSIGRGDSAIHYGVPGKIAAFWAALSSHPLKGMGIPAPFYKKATLFLELDHSKGKTSLVSRHSVAISRARRTQYGGGRHPHQPRVRARLQPPRVACSPPTSSGCRWNAKGWARSNPRCLGCPPVVGTGRDARSPPRDGATRSTRPPPLRGVLPFQRPLRSLPSSRRRAGVRRANSEAAAGHCDPL